MCITRRRIYEILFRFYSIVSSCCRVTKWATANFNWKIETVRPSTEAFHCSRAGPEWLIIGTFDTWNDTSHVNSLKLKWNRNALSSTTLCDNPSQIAKLATFLFGSHPRSHSIFLPITHPFVRCCSFRFARTSNECSCQVNWSVLLLGTWKSVRVKKARTRRTAIHN